MQSDRRGDPDPPAKVRKMSAAKRKRQLPTHAHALDTSSSRQSAMTAYMKTSLPAGPDSFARLDSFRLNHGGVRRGSWTRCPDGSDGGLASQLSSNTELNQEASRRFGRSEAEQASQKCRQGQRREQRHTNVGEDRDARTDQPDGLSPDLIRGHSQHGHAGNGVHDVHPGQRPRLSRRNGNAS